MCTGSIEFASNSCTAEIVSIYRYMFRLAWSSSSNTNSFIHSIAMCRVQGFLAILRSFFHSSLSYTNFLPLFSTNYSSILPHFILPSIRLSLGPVDSKYIYNTVLGILFSSILCTCPNQYNLALSQIFQIFHHL
jgi:hypothetical protein